MARSNKAYYIAPSAISITPNANASPRDFAVYVAPSTKLKIYVPSIAALGMDDGSFQEWSLTGRNRRLSSDVAYTIYARLNKTDKTDGYLVFAPKVNGADKYVLTPNTTRSAQAAVVGADGKSYDWAPLTEAQYAKRDYWWVKIGEVGAVVNNARTMSMDTGILGTDEYNSSFDFEPDAMPLRVVITTSKTEGEGAVPYVPFDATIQLSAALVEGWATDVSERVASWVILRDTGNAEEDAVWNADALASGRMASGTITLAHENSTYSDFGEAAVATFTIRALDAEDNILAANSTSIFAEQATGDYGVDLDFTSFCITVDDVGNVIGGLWKEEETTDAAGQPLLTRTYRIHSAVFARKGEKFLTMAPAGQAPGKGQYQIYLSNDGTTDLNLLIDNGTVYIAGIRNIHDGVSQTTEILDYDAMRAMKEATATVIVNCEGRVVFIKSFGIAIYHQETPYINAVIDNMASSVAWLTRQQAYVGLPITAHVTLSKDNVTLIPTDCGFDIDGTALTGETYEDTTTSGGDVIEDDRISYISGGWNIRFTRSTGELTILAVPRNLSASTALGLSLTVLYAGVSYERRVVHTIMRREDVNVYSLLISTSALHVDAARALQGDSPVLSVWCDDSEGNHYIVDAAGMTREGLSFRGYGVTKTGRTAMPAIGANGIVDLNAGNTNWLTFGELLFQLIRNAGTANEVEEDVQTLPVVADGAVGGNAIRMDLTNEMDSILYDGAGNRISGAVSTSAKMYDGATDVTAVTTFAVTVRQGIADGAFSLSNNILTVEQIQSGYAAAYIELRGTYNGVVREERFSLLRLEGMDRYEIETATSSVIYDPMSGDFLPAAGVGVDVYVTRQNGTRSRMTTAQMVADGLTVRYTYSGGSIYTLLTPSTDATAVTSLTVPISAFAANREVIIEVLKGSTLMDREGVPCISNGQQGRDGQWLEYIYKLSATKPSANETVDITSTPFEQGSSPDDDDFVPKGWTDSPTGVDETAAHKYEWVSLRTKTPGSGWGAFSKPVIWSAYGDKGADGDGVEYIFKLTNTYNTEAGLPSYPGTNPPSSGWGTVNGVATEYANTIDDWVPDGWTDNPADPWESMPYCWVSQRKRRNNTWSTFSQPTLWAKYAEDGDPGPAGPVTEYIYRRSNALPVAADSTALAYEETNGIANHAAIETGAYATLLNGLAASYDTGTHAGHVYDDWSETAQGVDVETARYEWCAPRVKRWSEADQAYLWGGIGEIYVHAAAGRDGNSQEFIYKLASTQPTSSDTVPTAAYNGKTIQDDGYVPQGWTDRPSGVDSTAAHKFEWVSTRKRSANGAWGAFSAPAVWAAYGDKGRDGDGIEYIFKRTSSHAGTASEPTFPVTGSGASPAYPLPANINNGRVNGGATTTDKQEDEWVPDGWDDDPMDATETAQYVWMSRRKESNDIWGAFSTPTLWVKFGKDGDDGVNAPVREHLYRRSNSLPVTADSTALQYVESDGADDYGALSTDELCDAINDLAPTYNTGAHAGHVYGDWTTEPQGVDKTHLYEWCVDRICQWDADNNPVWSELGDIYVHAAAGADGTFQEWIYKQATAEPASSATVPSSGTGTVNGVTTQYDNTIDDWVPSGWTDDPQGVNTTYRYEWASTRTKTNGVWGPFSKPVVWSRFEKGDPGDDGNGVGTVSIQYLRTIQPSGVTAQTLGDWGAYAEPTPLLPYLWKRTVTTYLRALSGGSDTVITCELVKTYQPGVGQNLLSGTSFADMSVVKKNWSNLANYPTRPSLSGYAYRVSNTEYSLSTSPSVRPSSYSLQYPTITPSGYYRWEREVLYYVKSGETITYSSQLQYAVSSSDTSFEQVSGKGWSTTTYTTEEGEYLWKRRIYTFKDGGGNTVTPSTSETAVVRVVYRQASTGYGFNGIGIIGAGVQGRRAYVSSVQFGSGNIGSGMVMMEQSVSLEPSTWYTLSFFAKRAYTDTSDGDTTYLENSYTPLQIIVNYTQGVIDASAGAFLNGVAVASIDEYLTLAVPLTAAYQEYVITFKTASYTGTPSIRFFQPETGAARYHSEVSIAMPKLEAGMIATGWNETSADIRADAHPIPKPAGQFTPGVTYTVTDYGFPYVWMPSETAASGRQYYMLLFGSFQGSADKTPANNLKGNSAGTGQWLQVPYSAVQMVETLIANGGKVGSAVFWEEFMFSQYGVNANGIPTMDYGQPVQAGGSFTPNFLIDFLKGDFYARTGYFSGFTRRVPTVLTPTAVGSQIQIATDPFEWDEQQSSPTKSSHRSQLHYIPTLDKCGAWMVFDETAEGDDFTEGSQEVRVHLPFCESFWYDYPQKQGEYTVTNTLATIMDITTSEASAIARTELFKAMSYQGCIIEITNLTANSIYIRGLRGPIYEGDTVPQDPWRRFELNSGYTLIAQCSFNGMSSGSDAYSIGRTTIAWDIKSVKLLRDGSYGQIDWASLFGI